MLFVRRPLPSVVNASIICAQFALFATHAVADQASERARVAASWAAFGESSPPVSTTLHAEASKGNAAARAGAKILGAIIDSKSKDGGSNGDLGRAGSSIIDRFNKYSLEDHGRKLGSIDREAGKVLHREFAFKDANGNPFGSTLKENVLDLTLFSSITDIFDENEKLVGKIREKLGTTWRTMGLVTKYEVLDGEGNLVAISKKPFKWVGTDFVLYSPVDGRQLIKLHRPFFQVTDPWDIEIADGSSIDPRIVLSILAEKSTSDHEK